MKKEKNSLRKPPSEAFSVTWLGEPAGRAVFAAREMALEGCPLTVAAALQAAWDRLVGVGETRFGEVVLDKPVPVDDDFLAPTMVAAALSLGIRLEPENAA